MDLLVSLLKATLRQVVNLANLQIGDGDREVEALFVELEPSAIAQEAEIG